jgi:uncharacterized protein YdhG (YjbR/CyaY superfamily)
MIVGMPAAGTPEPSGPELVDRYLADVPQPQQDTLAQLRSTLLDLVPRATEAMKYAMPAVLVDGKGVAGYAAFAGHCGYYPHSGTVLERAGEVVSGYPRSKGALRFAVDEPLPAELVRMLVRLRLDELGLADELR